MISGESMMCFLHQSLPEKLAVFFNSMNKYMGILESQAMRGDMAACSSVGIGSFISVIINPFLAKTLT